MLGGSRKVAALGSTGAAAQVQQLELLVGNGTARPPACHSPKVSSPWLETRLSMMAVCNAPHGP
jgi:hypothetical protein